MTGNSDSSNYNWKLYTSKDGKSYTCDYTDKTHWSSYQPTLEACKNFYNTEYPSGTHSVDYGTLSFYNTTDKTKTTHNCWISNNVPCKLTEFTPHDGLTDSTQLFLPKTVTLCGVDTNCAIPAFPPESTESNSGGKIILILVISVISIFLFIILFYLYKKYKTI